MKYFYRHKFRTSLSNVSETFSSTAIQSDLLLDVTNIQNDHTVSKSPGQGHSKVILIQRTDIQWWMYGTPPPPQTNISNFRNFLHFMQVFGKFWKNCMLRPHPTSNPHHPIWSAPPRRILDLLLISLLSSTKVTK